MYTFNAPHWMAFSLVIVWFTNQAFAAPDGYIDTGLYGQQGTTLLQVSPCTDSGADLLVPAGSGPLQNFFAWAVQRGCNCPPQSAEHSSAYYFPYYPPSGGLEPWRVGRRYSWSGGTFTPRQLRFTASGNIGSNITGHCQVNLQCGLTLNASATAESYAAATVNDSVSGQFGLKAHAKATDSLWGTLTRLAKTINVPPSNIIEIEITAGEHCGFSTSNGSSTWLASNIGTLYAWNIQPLVEVNVGIISANGRTAYRANFAAAITNLNVNTLQVSNAP